MTGRVVHFEIPYGESDRAKAFYAEAFGWELLDIPEMSYTLATTGPSDETGPSEPGFVNGGLLRRESPAEGPIIVIDVPDIDAALAKIESLGGSTVLGRQAAGDMGFAAYFKDVEGNIMGLWQSA